MLHGAVSACSTVDVRKALFFACCLVTACGSSVFETGGGSDGGASGDGGNDDGGAAGSDASAGSDAAEPDAGGVTASFFCKPHTPPFPFCMDFDDGSYTTAWLAGSPATVTAPIVTPTVASATITPSGTIGSELLVHTGALAGSDTAEADYQMLSPASIGSTLSLRASLDIPGFVPGVGAGLSTLLSVTGTNGASYVTAMLEKQADATQLVFECIVHDSTDDIDMPNSVTIALPAIVKIVIKPSGNPCTLLTIDPTTGASSEVLHAGSTSISSFVKGSGSVGLNTKAPFPAIDAHFDDVTME